jgi:nitrate reductase NapAB chaperone NapD
MPDKEVAMRHATGAFQHRRGPAARSLALARTALAATLLLALTAAGLRQSAAAPLRSTVAPVSSLLFGTNMALLNANEQLLTNPNTQQLLRTSGVPLIRVPFRATLPDAVETQALQTVKSIGAVPLVVVRGATDATALADDTHSIQLVQGVFGASTVYVEFGNEDDLAGTDAQTYTAAWNQVVPQLKKLAPSYKFIGPATYQANPTYIAAFDQAANPRPDYNSWHEYACGPSNSDDFCLTAITRWNTHIQQTNAAVRVAIGTTLPIMITEWNLDAQPDPRYSDVTFMSEWTTAALQTLTVNADNGLFAAAQYCAASNDGFNLIDGNNTLTPQGQIFFKMLAQVTGRALPAGMPAGAPQMAGLPAAPTPVVTDPTPSITFEDGGTDGWTALGGAITALRNSTDHAHDGSHALAIALRDVTAASAPSLTVTVQTPMTQAQTLGAWLYVPPGLGPLRARLAVMNALHRWRVGDQPVPLAPGWNYLVLGYSGTATVLALRLTAAPGASVSGTIYLDDVHW